jgi:hypothetical protein
MVFSYDAPQAEDAPFWNNILLSLRPSALEVQN